MSAKARSPYIVGPWYDWLFFLLPPTAALGLGVAISNSAITNEFFDFHGNDVTWAGLGIGVFIHAHLFAVFFRSHVNPSILRLHPFRFITVPIALFAAMMWSPWVIVSCSVLATFWDVYHSGLQTFGFSRIYDSKVGNSPTAGRRLDWWLNHLLYAGPIVAGATMMDHFEDFNEFEMVGSAFLTAVPAWMEGNQRYFTWSILGAGLLFLIYYVYAYWRLSRQGYQVSRLKVFLLTSTGLCSIYSWGFNSWGEAFFIMNFFHALQYFGLVWAFERKHITTALGVSRLRFGAPLALLVFLSITFAYGYFVQAFDTSIRAFWGLTLIVSLMHFWYDGFIWSVKKKQV
ncbi:MAG: hypothetical protein KC636_03315 [Myxococcales bacterium]|nr:hypothetical protein [Myxococcales bacterium]